MQKEPVIIAKREKSSRTMYSAFSTLILFVIVLVLDIIFYTRDRATWLLVLLIITAVLVVLELTRIMFILSNHTYSKKIKNIPLITFDGEDFIVINCLSHKCIRVNKEDVVEFKVGEKGDSYLLYKKENRKTSMFIGYSNRDHEAIVNNELQKYKNLY